MDKILEGRIRRAPHLAVTESYIQYRNYNLLVSVYKYIWENYGDLN